jgi:hypothetical protein
VEKLEEGVKSVFKKKDKKENSTTANTNQDFDKYFIWRTAFNIGFHF